jgi:gliding motility-associated-like protein
MKRLLLLCLTFWAAGLAAQQTVVTLTVVSGTSTSTCIDLFSAPDFFWQLNVENEGWITYPREGNCYTELPHQQYMAAYDCPVDVPALLQVCFQAFENDDLLYEIGVGCGIDASCLETICETFAVPFPGQSATYTIAIANGASTGEATFIIETSRGLSFNDAVCNPEELGTLGRGDTLGNFNLGIYDNICATAIDEPNPNTQGGFNNENGVWFRFTTGDDIGAVMRIEARSDPEGTGNGVDMQLALYQSDNDECDGNFQLLGWVSNNNTYDAFLRFRCPQPNTTYWILIDGTISGPGSEEGFFGLQVTNPDVDDAPDLRCDALDLGEVPEGGSVGLDRPVSNYCATSTGDPFSPNFVLQSSAWFKFVAPPSGHVRIEAISSREIDSIGIQLGLYRPFNNNCALGMQHIASQYTMGDLDEILQVSCLFPGQTYYFLVDGDADYNRGIFTVEVFDAGDIRPVFNQEVTICAGDSFMVGSSVYTQTGLYADTIPLFMGCDSIVNTSLTVLPPLSIVVQQIRPAIGEGGASGIATASAAGGSGEGYVFEWCNGLTGTNNETLVGGELCCVQVTDSFGCTVDTCFVVDFVTEIIVEFQGDTLACHGDATGQIIFSASSGLPPYTYAWRNVQETAFGAGTMNFEGEEITLVDLPAGTYIIAIMDEFFQTTITVEIIEPEPLVLMLDNQSNASCFSICDGAAAFSASGGVGGYQFAWSNGETQPALTGLCAGPYQVTLTDANGCEQIQNITVTEPPEFIVTVVETQPVSCFGGTDGIATAQTNGNPSAYAWANGGTTAAISSLPAGEYEVVVTNADGCQATGRGTITQPAAPVTAQIVVEQPVNCQGDANAVLRAVPGGPGDSFTINWSNGSTAALLSGLPAGAYAVLVRNEKGCEAEAQLDLGEPELVRASLSVTDITCLSGDNGGIIQVEETTGGVPPYQYALDGILFAPSPVFSNLFAGAYTLTVRDAVGCEQEFDATVNPAPELVVELEADASIQLGDSVRITALTNSMDVVFTWTFPDSLGKSDGPPAVWARPLLSSGYAVEVFDTVTFCRATDFIFIGVRSERRVFIPNAFSPNADGNNDMLTVFSDNAVRQVKTFRIFSRYGSLVFEDEDFLPNDPNRGWDGTFRGGEMPPGVYVYVAEIEFVDGRTELFKGDVTLVR